MNTVISKPQRIALDVYAHNPFSFILVFAFGNVPDDLFVVVRSDLGQQEEPTLAPTFTALPQTNQVLVSWTNEQVEAIAQYSSLICEVGYWGVVQGVGPLRANLSSVTGIQTPSFALKSVSGSQEVTVILGDLINALGAKLNQAVQLQVQVTDSVAANQEILGQIETLATNFTGWTAVEGGATDGERKLRKLTNWVGGAGQKPPVTGTGGAIFYLGPNGYTTDISQAIDFGGAPGRDGVDGTDGTDGTNGAAATITIGTVTTGNPGTSVVVNNSGTNNAAVLDFTIPRGATGAKGDSADPFLLRKRFGIVMPQIKTAAKFENLGAALPSVQLAVHSSGTGLISATPGSNADGYLKLPAEVHGFVNTRTDWLLSWDTTESGASITLGLGTSGSGYAVTIANSGGNVVITWPSGATTTGALSGTVNMNISLATANGGITASAHILGSPASLTSTNPYRVPVYDWQRLTLTGLYHAYFKTNCATSKIIGFLHNMRGWDGDPTCQLLTRTMLANASGMPVAFVGGSTLGENESIIVIPERTQVGKTVKVCHFFHGRSLSGRSIFDVTIADAGETPRQLLALGYAVIASSGGIYNTGAQTAATETDWWGNPVGTQKASEVYETLFANVPNIGKEYLIGWSMGGVSSLNYARTNPDRIGAIWLSCPVTDLEESGNSLAIQTSSTLKASLDRAYCSYYVSLVNGNTADPQTDNGTNWRQISGPGQYPSQGFRNYAISTVQAGVTNSAVISIASGVFVYPGDILHFKYSGQTRQIVQMASNTYISLDAPVTLSAGDPVSILRPDARRGYDYAWLSGRPMTEWSASTKAKGDVVLRKSARPELDVRPHNPTRFADLYAQLNVPVRIMVGGDGTSAGNDGILNNAPMFAFRDAVNAFRAGLITIVAGSGGHLTAGTVSASDTTTFFEAN